MITAVKKAGEKRERLAIVLDEWDTLENIKLLRTALIDFVGYAFSLAEVTKQPELLSREVWRLMYLANLLEADIDTTEQEKKLRENATEIR